MSTLIEKTSNKLVKAFLKNKIIAPLPRRFTKKLQKTTENYKNSLASIQYRYFKNKIFKNKNSNC